MPFHFVTLNVNSDRRLYKGTPLEPAFSDFSFRARFGLLKELLDSLSEDEQSTFALQEADDEARELLKDYFKQKGYNVLTTKYANDPGAFNFLFAYNPALYEVVESSQIYYTESGQTTSPEERKTLTKEEKLKLHLGTEFEKSAQLVRLKDKKTGKICLAANTHPGLEMAHRLSAMKKLCDALANEHEMIVALGDFNQFDPRVPEPTTYQEQIDILKTHGFKWSSEGLSHAGMKTTFMGFPFDVMRFFNEADRTEYQALTQDKDHLERLREFFVRKIKEKQISLYGGCLNGVFTKNLPESASVSVHCFTMFGHRRIETTTYPDAKGFQEAYIRHVETHIPEENEAVTSSDHFAVTATIG